MAELLLLLHGYLSSTMWVLSYETAGKLNDWYFVPGDLIETVWF